MSDPSEDRRAIIDVTIAYCWALDEKRFDDLADVFLPDGVAIYAGARCVGVPAIAAFCNRALGPLDCSQHLVTNHQVAIGGDSATSRCYFHAQHVPPAATGEANHIVAGRYEDRLSRTAAGWRIAERVLTVMWRTGE